MSQMIEVKTAELEGAALDWAVAQIEDVEVEIVHGRLTKVCDSGGTRLIKSIRSTWTPSTDWAQGGPLIDKHKPSIIYYKGLGMLPIAGMSEGLSEMYASETILIAACRAIVAAKLSDTVAVPAELLP